MINYRASYVNTSLIENMKISKMNASCFFSMMSDYQSNFDFIQFVLQTCIFLEMIPFGIMSSELYSSYFQDKKFIKK